VADPVADPAASLLTPQADLGLLRQLWRFRDYGRAELRYLMLGLFMRVGELLADMATPWPLALVINHVVKGHAPGGFLGKVATLFGTSTTAMLAVAGAATLVTTALSGAFDYLGDRFMNGAGERITSAIRRTVFGHLQRLPMPFHDRQAVGELTSRVITDTGRIEESLVELFATFVPGLVSLIGYAVVLLSVSWRLGLIAVCAAPVLFIVAARYTRLTRVFTRRRRAAEGRLSGFAAESLQGIRTIHAFGRQDLHDERFDQVNASVLGSGLRAVELRARFVPLLEVIAAVGTATLLFVGGYGVVHGWLSIGVLVVVTSYLKDMLKPMKQLSKLALTFTQGAASAERVGVILDRKPPEPEIERVLPERIAGEIALCTVTLDYGRGPVVDGLNLLIHPGERVALLGHNGAGKSSVLALIAGLYPPTKGQVRLDRMLLDRNVPDWWRHKQVAMVLQDTFLFSGTIAENIRYARPTATDAEVARAAEAALVTEFTDRLEKGLHTELGDRGIGLSGGQRQRVGIARAMLADAPIVLLDEPTASLDLQAEELVVRALSRLVRGRTVVMTTHQPALTRMATRTVRLREGRLEQPARNDRPRRKERAAGAEQPASTPRGDGEAQAPRQRDGEAARQRDGEAARQRDEETPRQRDGEAARQRDEETPRQRDEETPRQRDEETPRQRDEETPRQLSLAPPN
jgi:ABC-type multidrug transport system fused ATPase/permease subunit